MQKKRHIVSDRRSHFVDILSRIYPLIFIGILGIIIYSNSFDCSFHYDDNHNIIMNKAIRDIHDLNAIWNYGNLKRFVGFYTFALNYHFNQDDVFGYHLVNLLIHIGSSFFVWWLVLLIFPTPVMKKVPISRYKKFIALTCSLLFLSHPVQTQAITYIYQRLASLATFFYLATLSFYISARISKKKRVALLYYVISVIMGLLGMFTKETVFTLPFTIILFEFSLISGGALFNLKNKKILLYVGLTLLFTVILPAFYLSGIKQIFGPKTPIGSQGATITFGFYLMTQFRVIVTYIRLLFLPIHQNLDYDFPVSRSFFEPHTFFSFLFLISIFVTAIWLFPRKRYMSLGIIWFSLTLSIESIIPLSDLIYEHRLYLPMFGFCLFFTSMLYHFLLKKNSAILVIIIVSVVSWFSFLTYQRNKIWKNDYTLWSDVVRKSPQKWRPNNNLGNYLFSQGRYEEAVEMFKKALQIKPDDPNEHNVLGSVYLHLKRFDEAAREFKMALSLNPMHIEARYNLGGVLSFQGKVNEAIEEYKKLLSINPTYIDAYYNLGIIFYHEGNIEEAVTNFLKVVSLNPAYVDASERLATCYMILGKETESKIHSDTADSLKHMIQK